MAKYIREGQAQVNFRCDEKLKSDFYSKVESQGKNVTEVFVELMRNYLGVSSNPELSVVNERLDQHEQKLIELEQRFLQRWAS